jgi:hypothetical protein
MSIRLVEYASGHPEKVDTDKGVIHGVKFLGRQSSHGREYSVAAMRKAVTSGLYENRPVYTNHVRGNQERDVRNCIGHTCNATVRDDGVFGDIKYFKSDPFSAKLAEAAASDAPNVFGMSHIAYGDERKRRGQGPLIENIELVESVDVVAAGATTKGLYESQGPTMKTAKSVLLEHFKKPEQKKLIEEEMPAAAAEMPADAPTDVDGAFKAMICGVFDDTSLDSAGKMAKIKEILKAHEKLTGKADEAPPEAPKEEPKTESKGKGAAASDDVKLLREELAIRDLIEDAGLTFGKPEARKAFAKALIPLSESERKELIEERKGAAPTKESKGGSKPKSKLIKESAGDDDAPELPTDRKSLLQLVR